MSGWKRRLWAAGLLLSSACSLDFSVPTNGRITCATDSDCPQTGTVLTCHNGFCVRPQDIDNTLPDLAALPQVSPPIGKAGTVFQIALVTTKPVLSPVLVPLHVDPPVQLQCPGTDDTHYTCQYTATGQENGGLGGTASFDVDLVDRGANESLKRFAGQLVLDFTPPSLAAQSVEPPLAKLGTQIQVFFTASEPLDGGALVTSSLPLDPGTGGPPQSQFVLQAEGTTLNYRLVHLVTSNDPVTPDGGVQFSVTMADLAGNVATQVIGATSIDNTLPGITFAPLPARAKDSATVAVDFTIDKPLAAPPSVTIGGVPMIAGTPSGSWQYHYTHAVSAAQDTEGASPVLVDALDAAGNELIKTLGIVTYDFTPPYLLGQPVVQRTDNLASANTPSGLLLSRTDPYGVLDGGVPQARISFVVSEPLADGGVVVSVGDAGAILDPTSSSPPTYSFLYTPLGTEPEVATPVTASLTDLAGNAAAAPLGTIIFSFTAPDAGAVSKITYSRDVPEYLFRLRADDGAFSPGAQVRVFTSPTAPVSVEVTSSPTGNLPPTVVPGDLPTVYVSQLDAAGNLSPLVDVKRIEWVASFANKQQGSILFNPHGAFYASAAAALPGSSIQELSNTDYAALAEPPDAGSPWLSSGAASTWVATSLGRRGGGAIAFDAARERVVFFGGETADTNNVSGPTGNGPYNDTWSWDGTRWAQLPTSSGAPSPRVGHALAYDVARGRTVLFGGSVALGAKGGDTWEWDGELWFQRAPAASPQAREAHAMAYDAAHRQVVLFGGSASGGVVLGDTWTWDGTNWVLQNPAVSPPARTGPAMAYDSARGRVVLFGGSPSSGAPFNDTWEWDGTNWTQRTPTTSPPARSQAALAFDAAHGRTLLFGGAASQTDFSDVWSWDGTNWTQLSPTTSPPARYGASMTFDGTRGRIVLFGGDLHCGAATACLKSLGDTWLWDGTTWTQGPAEPPMRWEAELAYDSARGRTVLFGGTAGGPLGDTWEWDGTLWTKKTPAQSPPARGMSALAFDAARGETVLFGGKPDAGALADTWLWDGGTWTQVTPASSPPARFGHAMAFDAAQKVVLLFGGSDGGTALNDTWQWNGSTWAQLSPQTSPPVQCGEGMAYDSVRSRVVIFGGETDVNCRNGGTWDQAAWEWDGTNWKSRGNPPIGLPFPWGASMAYDSARELSVEIADNSASPWGWDGTSWTQLAYPSDLGSTGHAGMAFDAQRGWTVVFGEDTANLTNWSGEFGAPLFPSLEVAAFAGTPPGTVLSVSISGSAGATATAGTGVVAEVWDGSLGAWRSLCPAGGTCNSAPASAIAPFSGIVDNSLGNIDGLVQGTKVQARLRPLGPPAPATPQPPALAAQNIRLYLLYQRP